jgi:hypothetical protein
VERVSVDNQILAFEKQFTKAAERFEVCRILIINVTYFVCSYHLWQVLSGITLARGQDLIIRGQDDLMRVQGNLVHMVQKVRPFIIGVMWLYHLSSRTDSAYVDNPRRHLRKPEKIPLR